MKSPSEEKQILLIGEILYAAAAWRSLSALGRLRVRLGSPDRRLTDNNTAPHLRLSPSSSLPSPLVAKKLTATMTPATE